MDMALETGSHRSQITATLHYLEPNPKWLVEKPFTLFVNVSHLEGAENTNITKEAVPGVTIENVRGALSELSLDRNGFEVVRLDGSGLANSFEDAGWVEEYYYPFVSRLISEKLGAKEVRVYQHKLRYRHPGFGDLRLRGHPNYDPPIPHVHADITPDYARRFFREEWPEAMDSPRIQILNLWRPLVEIVTEWPLALCDFTSVDIAKDLQPSDQVKRRKGSKISDNDFDEIESYVAFYNPQHKWYFLEDQEFNEGWVIKLYDSKQDTACNILHTSIDTGRGSVPRRSCETRMLVRY